MYYMYYDIICAKWNELFASFVLRACNAMGRIVCLCIPIDTLPHSENNAFKNPSPAALGPLRLLRPLRLDTLLLDCTAISTPHNANTVAAAALTYLLPEQRLRIRIHAEQHRAVFLLCPRALLPLLRTFCPAV